MLGSCDFGYECETLMLKYKALNIKPKYVTARTEFTFIQYLKFVPFSCMIADLKFAFTEQIKAKIKQNADEWTDEVLFKRSDDDIYPLSDWKMTSIFDETDQPLDGEYWNDLRRKEGRNAEELMKNKVKVNEKKLDWGYDILRTWKIEDVMKDF